MSPGTDSFIQSLMETDLYSIGAFFCDQHPQLVARSEASSSWRRTSRDPDRGGSPHAAHRLAVRYYKAVAG